MGKKSRRRQLFRRAWKLRIQDWHRFAGQLCGNWADAEDLVSEVYMRMLRANPPLTTVGQVHRYALRAIEARFFEQRRRRKARQAVVEALEREAPDALSAFLQASIDVGDEIDRERFYETVSRHMKRLPPESRAAIKLYFFAEPKCGYRELAERLGLSSVSAACERVQKALAELRTALRDEFKL